MLLSGLMVCAHCGQPVIKQGNDDYRCRGSRNGTCSAAPSIRQSRLEERVFARLMPMLLTPDLSESFDAALAKARIDLAGPSTGKTLAALTRPRRAAQIKIGNIVAAIADGKAPALLLAGLEVLEGEVNEIDAKIRQVEAMARQGETVPVSSAVTLSKAPEPSRRRRRGQRVPRMARRQDHAHTRQHRS
jgi:hypothetical protein